MIGFFNILKPTGLSSSDVVVRIKKILNVKQVGHMGTLDPLAAGVLPIAVGKATRLFDYLVKSKKQYVATFLFGIKTDTSDSTGKIIERNNKLILEKQITDILPEFIGKISQTPSKYSAIKINGERSYKLARNNVNFEMKSRSVTIFDIKLISFDSNYLTISVDCEGGTYIRTLGEDIASKLGTVCTMVSLIRTKSSCFDIDNSVSLEDISNGYENYLIDYKKVLDFDTIVLDNVSFNKLKNGIKIPANQETSEQFFVTDKNGLCLGIGEVNNGFITIKTNLYEGE